MAWTIKDIAKQLKLIPESSITAPINYNGKTIYVSVSIKTSKDGERTLYVGLSPMDKELQHEIVAELLNEGILECASGVNDKNASEK